MRADGDRPRQGRQGVRALRRRAGRVGQGVREGFLQARRRRSRQPAGGRPDRKASRRRPEASRDGHVPRGLHAAGGGGHQRERAAQGDQGRGVRPAAAAPAASAAAVAVAAAVAAALLRPSDSREDRDAAVGARGDDGERPADARPPRLPLRQPAAPAHPRLPHAVPAPAGQGDVRRAATGPRRVPWPLGRRQSVGEGGGRRREHAAPPPPRAVAAAPRGRARRAPVRAAARGGVSALVRDHGARAPQHWRRVRQRRVAKRGARGQAVVRRRRGPSPLPRRPHAAQMPAASLAAVAAAAVASAAAVAAVAVATAAGPASAAAAEFAAA